MSFQNPRKPRTHNIVALNVPGTKNRLSGLLAPTFGGLATLLMLLDFCCRVCCSNVLQTILIILAQLNTGFMFLIYASNVCLASTDSQYRGLCFPSAGSFMAWAALGLYFFGEFRRDVLKRAIRRGV